MIILELLLAIYATAGGLILIVWRSAGRSIWRWIAVIGSVLTLAVAAEGSHRIEAVPMIIVAVIVASFAFRRSRRQSPPPPNRRRVLSAALRCVAALLVVFVVVLDGAFIRRTRRSPGNSSRDVNCSLARIGRIAKVPGIYLCLYVSAFADLFSENAVTRQLEILMVRSRSSCLEETGR
jgi:hypothetical protein